MQLQKQSTFILQNSITIEQQQYFDKYGVIHFKNFIDKDTVALFIAEIKRVEQKLLDTNTGKINGIPLKCGTDTNGEKLIQRIAFASQYSTVLSNLLRSEKVKSLVQLLGSYEGRIGENEKDGLVVNHYINTEESKYSKLGWHTDSPRDLFLGSKILPMLNVGLHLDDCPQSNGGLRVLPGTHHQGLFKLLFKKKYFIDHTPDKKEKGFDIEAGDLTIHDGRLWHRVQQSPHVGEKSRRRVMYIPVVTGQYRPKSSRSRTPFYHKLAQVGVEGFADKLKWVAFKKSEPKKLAQL